MIIILIILLSEIVFASSTIIASKTLVKCSTLPPTILKYNRNDHGDDCEGLLFNISSVNFDPDFLDYIRTEIDENIHIQRIIIDWRSLKLTGNETYFRTIGKSLDDFLLKRPWFFIIDEPYDWERKEEETKKKKKKKSSNTMVILGRVLEYVKEMNEWVSFNLPDDKSCASRPMIVVNANCHHPGWMSCLGTFNYNHQEHNRFIRATWRGNSVQMIQPGILLYQLHKRI